MLCCFGKSGLDARFAKRHRSLSYSIHTGTAVCILCEVSSALESLQYYTMYSGTLQYVQYFGGMQYHTVLNFLKVDNVSQRRAIVAQWLLEPYWLHMYI